MSRLCDLSWELFKKFGHDFPKSEAEAVGYKIATLPIICVPTTLSGAEFNATGDATDDETKQKYLFSPGTRIGPNIILDPALTLTVPMHTWIASGVKAIDHCVETVLSSKGIPETDAYAMKALSVLIPGLLQSKADPKAIPPRLELQRAAVDAMRFIWFKVPIGGSHGIGHQLGPFGIFHGLTSCILMPSVQEYNRKVNKPKQEELTKFLCSKPEIANFLSSKGMDKNDVNLSNVLDVVIRELDMPRTLKDVGIGEETFETIAVNSLHDWCCQTNPIPLTKKEQVIEILRLAA
jgi:alcohol dehydrogenase class IV